MASEPKKGRFQPNLKEVQKLAKMKKEYDYVDEDVKPPKGYRKEKGESESDFKKRVEAMKN